MMAGMENDQRNDVRTVAVTDLECGDVLIGEADGRSVVFETGAWQGTPGLVGVRTEHGLMLLDPDAVVLVEV
jgi:hypothetical protein